jgi:hypothetical protein
MNGRQRLSAVLRKQPTDRLPWTTLVDNTSLDRFPAELRGRGGLDFYRHLGCDVFLLDGWNQPVSFRAPELCWAPEVRTEERWEERHFVRTWHAPGGSLTFVSDRGHPRQYPVDSLAALHLYRELWEGAHFQWYDETETLATLDGLLGDDGVATRFWGPTTIPRLLELDMGTMNFYYFMADYPAEMAGLIAIMHEREREAFRQLAAGPWKSVTLAENTSTYYISPKIYAQYNMPHQRECVELVKAAGKTALIHMCGHVRGLLDLIRETGCDGIHTLTPPPTGNTPWEDALDVLGEDQIIIGCLDPTIFALGPVDEIGPALDRLITPRLRASHFVLSPMADGLPIAPERFEAVARWVDAHGAG